MLLNSGHLALCLFQFSNFHSKLVVFYQACNTQYYGMWVCGLLLYTCYICWWVFVRVLTMKAKIFISFFNVTFILSFCVEQKISLHHNDPVDIIALLKAIGRMEGILQNYGRSGFIPLLKVCIILQNITNCRVESNNSIF